jgi:hypothetical protein
VERAGGNRSSETRRFGQVSWEEITDALKIHPSPYAKRYIPRGRTPFRAFLPTTQLENNRQLKFARLVLSKQPVLLYPERSDVVHQAVAGGMQ